MTNRIIKHIYRLDKEIIRIVYIVLFILSFFFFRITNTRFSAKALIAYSATLVTVYTFISQQLKNMTEDYDEKSNWYLGYNLNAFYLHDSIWIKLFENIGLSLHGWLLISIPIIIYIFEKGNEIWSIRFLHDIIIIILHSFWVSSFIPLFIIGFGIGLKVVDFIRRGFISNKTCDDGLNNVKEDIKNYIANEFQIKPRRYVLFLFSNILKAEEERKYIDKIENVFQSADKKQITDIDYVTYIECAFRNEKKWLMRYLEKLRCLYKKWDKGFGRKFRSDYIQVMHTIIFWHYKCMWNYYNKMLDKHPSSYSYIIKKAKWDIDLLSNIRVPSNGELKDIIDNIYNRKEIVISPKSLNTSRSNHRSSNRNVEKEYDEVISRIIGVISKIIEMNELYNDKRAFDYIMDIEYIDLKTLSKNIGISANGWASNFKIIGVKESKYYLTTLLHKKVMNLLDSNYCTYKEIADKIDNYIPETIISSLYEKYLLDELGKDIISTDFLEQCLTNLSVKCTVALFFTRLVKIDRLGFNMSEEEYLKWKSHFFRWDADFDMEDLNSDDFNKYLNSKVEKYNIRYLISESLINWLLKSLFEPFGKKEYLNLKKHTSRGFSVSSYLILRSVTILCRSDIELISLKEFSKTELIVLQKESAKANNVIDILQLELDYS
ncbi:hypothetical protein [Abiotrophia defectiva]|uniref:hypothetical protein n=1 Tax=Abiotrophia defectiva TaxID=46125 RepID=UPI0028EAFE64|nr:hypothetical protein [Abiotrophia defectiva]